MKLTPLTLALIPALLAGQTQAAPTELGKGEGQLNIVAWAGYVERGETDKNYDWVTGFEKETGCKVNVKTAATSDEMVALMNEGGFDLVTASGDASLRLIAGGKVQIGMTQVAVALAGKLVAFTAAWQGGYSWLVVVAILLSLVAAFIYFRMIVVMFFREPVDSDVQVASASWMTWLVVWIGAIGTLVLGVWGGPLLTLAEKASVFLR